MGVHTIRAKVREPVTTTIRFSPPGPPRSPSSFRLTVPSVRRLRRVTTAWNQVAGFDATLVKRKERAQRRKRKEKREGEWTATSLLLAAVAATAIMANNSLSDCQALHRLARDSLLAPLRPPSLNQYHVWVRKI